MLKNFCARFVGDSSLHATIVIFEGGCRQVSTGKQIQRTQKCLAIPVFTTISYVNTLPSVRCSVDQVMSSINHTTEQHLMNTTLSSTVSTISEPLIYINWYYSSRFWLALGTAGFLCNILEFIIILRQKKHKEKFGLTLTSLCIADIIGSLSLGVTGGLRLLKYSGPKSFAIYEKTTMALLWRVGHGSLQFAVGTSFMHIIFIAIQRLLAVLMPLKFKANFTYARCAAGVILTWLVMFIYGTFTFLFSRFMHHLSYYFVLIMELILIITYGAITLKTWKDDKKRASLKSESSSQGSTDDATHRVLFHSLAVTLAFLICTMPHSIFYIYLIIHRLLPSHDLNTYHVVNVLISINPFLDPLIYFFFMNHLSKYCFKKRGSKPIRGKVSPNVQIQMQNIVTEKV